MNAFLNTAFDVHDIDVPSDFDTRDTAEAIAEYSASVHEGVEAVARIFAILAIVCIVGAALLAAGVRP